MVEITHRFDEYKKQYINAVPPDGKAIRIKHKDYFHMKNLYVLMHEWLIEEGWASRKDTEFPEEFMLHKESQKSGTEMWIWWRMNKTPTGQTYYRYFLDIDVHVILLKDAEVMHDGVKYKANWGEPEIKLWAKLVVDADKKWQDHWFLKHIHFIFWKRIFKNNIDMHQRELYREVYRLFEACKTYLKLQTYLPEPEGQKFYEKKDFAH